MLRGTPDYWTMVCGMGGMFMPGTGADTEFEAPFEVTTLLLVAIAGFVPAALRSVNFFSPMYPTMSPY